MRDDPRARTLGCDVLKKTHATFGMQRSANAGVPKFEPRDFNACYKCEWIVRASSFRLQGHEATIQKCAQRCMCHNGNASSVPSRRIDCRYTGIKWRDRYEKIFGMGIHVC